MKITGISKPPPPRDAKQSAPAKSQTSGRESAGAEGHDSVRIGSSLSSALRATDAQVQAGEGVLVQQRIDELKTALSEGRFEPDPLRIADAILREEFNL